MTRISTGTASIDTGETILTLWVGDDGVVLSEITAPAGSQVVIEGVANFIKTRLSTTSAELVLPHAGAGGANLPLAISAMTPAETQVGTLNGRVAKVVQDLSVVQANGLGLGYRFSTATADGDPGPGYVRLNHVDPALATMLYIDDLSGSGFEVGAMLSRWGIGTSLIKGAVQISSASNDGMFAGFEVTGPVVDGGSYRKVPIGIVGDPSAWTDDAELMVAFAAKGDAGDGFAYDDRALTTAELTTFEGNDPGHLVFVRDLGTDFGALTGISGVVELIAGPDWRLVARYTGDKGDKGDRGYQGWAQNIVTVVDGLRRVEMLASYVGGQGAPPTDFVGQYRKGDGTWTANVAEAADKRGPGGTGTVGEIVAGVGMSVDNADPTAPEISLKSPTSQAGIDPVYIEQLLTGFHGRGMLTAEAVDLVTEQAITGTAAAGASSIVITNGALFDAGGNVTVKHDNGRYWTYFITAISSNTLTTLPRLKWPVSAAGGARAERTWYNKAHPGKFYMRQLGQRLAREKEWQNCLPTKGRLFFSQFVNSGSLANDQLVAIAGGVINYYDESSSNVASANAPVRFAIGKAAYIDVAAAGDGGRTAIFPVAGVTGAILRVVVHCSRSDTVCTIRVVDDDARVNAEFVVPAASSNIPTVYTLPVRVHGDAKNLSVHFVGTTVPVAGAIIADQIEVFAASPSGEAAIPETAVVVGYGDSWVAGDIGSSTERESFLTQLQAELPDALVINEGIPGGDVFDLLANFDTAVVPHSPTHVIVCAGTNDAYSPSSATFDPTAIEGFTLAMLQLISRITGIGARPIILGVPALAEADGAFASWDLNARAMKYSRNLYSMLSSTGDPRGGWSSNSVLSQYIIGRPASSVGAVNGKTLGEDAFESSRSTTGAAGHAYFYNPNGTVGMISTSGSATSYLTSSDESLKDFAGLYDPLAAIEIIRADPVRSFTWKVDGAGAVGWGAQTSYSVSTDLAVPGEGAIGDKDFRPWGVDQGKRTPYLWAALSWALDQIESLEQRVAALESENQG
ncbi:GDSL-type esterase/lipase family protein [Devosia sediminis]|uniref:Peptidase S74 domain-containing protein n=1 Tax=Devosia sediminis TaxID=2798801 RepID=A0A934IME8_9HYPH|nr:GDSL-type esterase/lipase family protein [Devosia sediminis]MBJ3783429.1 hypothetical protein [Devosia sediminis]